MHHFPASLSPSNPSQYHPLLPLQMHGVYFFNSCNHHRDLLECVDMHILFLCFMMQTQIAFISNIFLSHVLQLIYSSFIEQCKTIFTSHDQETFITTPSFLCHLELSESPRRDFIRMNFFSKWLVYVLQWLHTPHTRPGHNKTLEKDWCGLGRSKQQVTPSTPLQMHCGVWCHHNPEVPSQWEGPLSTPDQVTLSFPIASSCPTSSRASVKGWHSKCSNRTELSKF